MNSPGTTSDLALLDAARAGDRDALELLLERHQAQVYRFGMKMCRDPEDAQDVLQETLLALARGVRDFRGASSISTWLYSVARSFCIKKRRRSKFAPNESSLDDRKANDAELPAEPSRGPEDAMAGKEVEQALEAAIRSLEPMYREVLLLRDLEGLSAAEVAEVLGIGVQAVKSRLHRARVMVRERVAPALGVSNDTAPNSTCPDVLTMFSQHVEDEISADVCIAMEKHLESCPRCRNACDSLKRTLALCRTAGPRAEVPVSVQQAVKRALKDFLREAP
jgi:RNA polymerase sigma-70 factor (ECF subfamily)